MDVRNEMKVKAIQEDKEKVAVVTTGAKYVFDKSGKKGKISCYQLLNKKRLMATIDFDCSFSTLSIERKDNTTCVLFQELGGCQGLRLQVNADSLLDIYSQGRLDLTFSGNFLPEYGAQKNGNVLLIDETGGIGFYPYKGLNNIEFTDFTAKEWKINYILDRRFRFLVSVFPPRKFNHTQSLQDRISHHGSLGEWDPPPYPYPSNEQIEELSRYTNILVLHEMIWQGKLTRRGIPVKTLADIYTDVPFCCCEYIPVDEKELRRVIEKAHSLKMKVIPYMSPFYSTAKGKDFLDKVEDRLEKYNFDGVYFDDISADDILCSYSIIRETRRLLKDKILYFHCTRDPLHSRNIYCPFIDTYADYILRAEGGPGFNDKYLRYVISGYNISNSIGYVCHHSYPLEFVKKIIDKVLPANARMYLGSGSPEIEAEELIKKEYFPRLEKESKAKC